jgi:hypothetical protein
MPPESQSFGYGTLRFPVPEAWSTVPLARPDLSQVPDVRGLAWNAWGPAGTDDAAHLVIGCFGGETRAWTDEAEPFVLDRLRAVVSSTALRAARRGGVRVRSTEHTRNVTSERIEGAGDAEGALAARTFLGFVDAGDAAEGHLVGCFALCVADLHACEASVRDADVYGRFVPSPRPTTAVRALVAMVHHPSATFGCLALLSCVLGVVAVVTRKRPRTK